MLEGNWLFTVLTGIVLFSFVGILFFNRTKFIAWAHEVKNRHTQTAGASAPAFFLASLCEGGGP